MNASDGWKHVSSTMFATCEVKTELKDDIYLVTLLGGVSDVSANRFEARKRLADKLELIVADLRRGL